jgi:hypothetical protein
MRGLAHRFGATGEHRGGFSQQQPMRALHHSLESRTAQPVHGHRGSGDRQPASQRDMARAVHRIARGLQRIPDNRVIHGFAWQSRARQCLTRSEDAKIGGSELPERAAEGAESGAHRGDEDDLGHDLANTVPQSGQCFQ